jgi:hypothetical protein
MNSAAFVFIVGLITTLAGVGGIEQSADLISAVIVAATGLSIMYAGSVMLCRADKDEQ